MKWLPALMMAGLCAFTACSDDEGNGEVFSNLEPEQHKQKLETEGVEFIKDMNAVANLETYDVMDAFMNLMNQEEVNPVIAAGLDQINALRQGPKTTVTLKSLVAETNSVSAEWEAEAGIYEWDETAGDWIHTANADQITYKFDVEGKQAVISATNFKVKLAKNQPEDGLTVVELPESLKVSLTWGETELCSFTFTGEWYDNDTPKYLEEKFSLEGFNYTAILNLKDKSNLKTESSFDYKGDVIIANGFGINGNIDYDAIFAEIEAMQGESEEMPAVNEILKSANAFFQVGNIKADALINVTELMDAMINKAESMDMEDEYAFEKMMIELLNAHSKFYIKYADSNEIFAKGEFYLDEIVDTYYDYNGQEITETYKDVSMRMLFPDGTAIGDDFFDNGFDKMINEINALIADINTSYGVQVEPIQ